LNTAYLAIALGGICFWAFHRALNPPAPKYAAKDFLEQEKRSLEEDRMVTKSIVHQLVYPIYSRVQQLKPLGKGQYEELQQELIKAGEYDSRPEDIQIAQLTNAILYPMFFLAIGLLIGGDYQAYIVFVGLAAGFYMYRAPLSAIKAKQKKHNEKLLQDFTRFVTVYLMQVSGNVTPDEAIKKSIKRTVDRGRALSYYLNMLNSNMETLGTPRALRRFAEALNKPYADRFVNNVQLAIKHAGGDQTSLNLRLRESLAEMAEQVADEKINSIKARARIPVFVSVGIIAVYMIVMLGVSMMMIF
jgi:hypothetical protein